MSFKEKLDLNKIPGHVAIIMDGNGRWARKHGSDRIFGHQNGVTAVQEVTEAAAEIKVKYLTLYAFSTENWNRPKDEVDSLMTLLVNTINTEKDKLNKNNIRLLTIGDIDSLPDEAKIKLQDIIGSTKTNTGLTVVLALSYSSKWEIIEAIKKIAEQVKSNIIDIKDITSEYFSNQLSTNGIPDPELMIRTSGEYRISNFLLWQIAYAELYFTPVLWPDVKKEDFFEAIYDFQQRERRFGLTSEQISTNTIN